MSCQGVLQGGVGGTSPECLSRAAMCLKLIAARAPGAVEAYRPEVGYVCTYFMYSMIFMC